MLITSPLYLLCASLDQHWFMVCLPPFVIIPMKTHKTYNSGLPSCAFLAVLLGFVSAALCMIPAASPGGLIFVTDSDTGTIGEYTTSGATVNPALISGLNFPIGLVIASSVPDESPTSTLLLLGVGAAFALNLLLHKRSEA